MFTLDQNFGGDDVTEVSAVSVHVLRKYLTGHYPGEKIGIWEDGKPTGETKRAGQSNKESLVKFFESKGITEIDLDSPPTPTSKQVDKPQFEIKKEFDILEHLVLTEDEKLEVETAIRSSGYSLNQLIKEGLLMKARKVVSETKKLQSLTDAEKLQTTIKGAADSRLREASDHIVMWNHGCYDNGLRVFLNASILRTLTGANLNSIKNFLDRYRTPDDFLETAEEHNNRYDLTENDNRKGRDEYGHRIAIADLIKYRKMERSEVRSLDVEPETTTDEIPAETTLEQFIEGLKKLDSEDAIKAACEIKMAELREQNSGKSVHSLSKLITPYRTEVAKLRLKTGTSYTHEYGTPRTLKDDESKPKGAVLDEQGRVVSEPRHVALQYLRLSDEETAEKNKK